MNNQASFDRCVPEIMEHIFQYLKPETVWYIVSLVSWSLFHCVRSSDREYVELKGLVEHAAKAGNICLLEWLKATYKDFDLYADRLVGFSAAKGNRLTVLKWAKHNNYETDCWTLCTAARCGYFKLLKWAMQPGNGMIELSDVEKIRVASLAEVGGHLEIKQYLDKLQWKDVVLSHTVGAQYVAYRRVLQCMESPELCDNTKMRSWVEDGINLHVLNWARENHCPWGETVCLFGAQGGFFEIVKWAREHGCPWDDETFFFALDKGNKEVVEWALLNGCVQLTHGHVARIVQIGDIKTINTMYDTSPELFAAGTCTPPRSPFTNYISQDCYLSGTLFEHACRFGKIDAMDWLVAKGWKEEITCVITTSKIIGKLGHLQVLKWLDSHKVWEQAICLKTLMQSALDFGHVNVMKWVKQKNSEVALEDICSKLSFAHAAADGYLHAIRWAYRYGSDNEFTAQDFRTAMKDDQVHVAKWALRARTFKQNAISLEAFAKSRWASIQLPDSNPSKKMKYTK